MENELKQYLEAMETRLNAHVDARFEQLETNLVDKTRRMQIEVLRHFSDFTESQTIRLRKLEADQSNLDSALSGRVAVLEKRLLEIELRLGRQM